MTSSWWSSSWFLLAVVALVVTALDQVTKSYAASTLGPEGDRDRIGIIPNVLQFRYVENTGAAFGMFQDSTTVLVFVSVGVIALLAVIFWGMISRSLLLAFAFGLQFGGAFGNLIDRVRLGYVVDFIDVPRFPTFNVADSGITVGVVILGFVMLFRPEVTVAPEQLERTTRQDDHPVDVLTVASEEDTIEIKHEGSLTRDSNV